MKIQIVTPSVPETLTGNVVTADRYATILRKLGHRVSVDTTYDSKPCDAVVMLHARRNAAAIQESATRYPRRPVIVVLTGTDLYRDIKTDPEAQRSLELATHLVVLQEMGMRELPERLRAKTRVIYQSAPSLRAAVEQPRTSFRVAVIGHLRPEKDPFRTALAARQLPASSRVQVVHVGNALSPDVEAWALQESASNPRYRWLGGRPHWQTRQILAASHLLSISSLMEGSSNVLCESLAQPAPTPVVASRISGLVGTLGEDYPGYFPAEDTAALTELLGRAETDRAFYEELREHCLRSAPLVQPRREHDAWQQLLAEIA
ncbi:MAG: TIGR04348 family glycosyltransferase [Chloroflexi bacterium]|nr:TIGR04348 family glycosyltransferase [Chloroflexota bacterium]